MNSAQKSKRVLAFITGIAFGLGLILLCGLGNWDAARWFLGLGVIAAIIWWLA